MAEQTNYIPKQETEKEMKGFGPHNAQEEHTLNDKKGLHINNINLRIKKVIHE